METLALPHRLERGEAATLRITAGILPRGARVVVRLASGKILGTVAPFGVLPGQKAGFTTIPVPADAWTDGKITVVLELEERGKPPRVPTPAEIEAVEVALIKVSGPPPAH